jgi:hypothetical protein
MNAEELATRLHGKQSNGSWSALCPAHSDKSPSLSITDGDKGGVVVHCHAGCATSAVLDAVGISITDLAPVTEDRDRQRSREVDRYRYVDETGQALFDVVRREPKAFHQEPANGQRGAGAMAGVRRVLYRLPEVLSAVSRGATVFITEGEKDANAIVAAGYCATTMAGGAGKWNTVAAHACQVLAGADIVIVRDNDKPGIAHAVEVAANLRDVAKSVLIVEPLAGFKDAALHLGAGHTIEELLEVDEAQDSSSDGTGGTPDQPEHVTMEARLLTIGQLRTLPAPEPLIGSLFDLDTLALLYGRRGSFKSFLALDWALHIAYGNRWHSQSVRQGHVLYVCAEGSHGLAQRIDAWKTHHGIIHDTDRLSVLPEAVNLMSPSQAGALAQVAATLGSRLVILDTWARCTVGGEENSTKDMGQAIEQLDVIRRASGACVLGVHHSGKDTTAGARGSSALEAAFDSVFEIGASDDIVTLKTTKQKHHAEGNPWYLRALPIRDSVVLAPNANTVDEVSASVLTTLAALAEIQVPGGVTASNWLVVAGKPEQTFYRHRKTLLTTGLIENTGSDKLPRYQVTSAGTTALS